MPSHHRPPDEVLPLREPMRQRKHVPNGKHAPAVVPNVRPFKAVALGVPRAKDADKTHICRDCRKTFRGEKDAVTHWRAHHEPKSVTLEDVTVCSVLVEGDE